MTALPVRLHPLFQKTKPVCFGRFVIEIPETAIIVFGPAEVGPEIFYLRGEGRQVARYVAKDLEDVETEREYFDKEDFANLPLFGKVFDGPVPGQKITLSSKDRVGYYMNSYIPIGGDLFILHVGSVMHEDYSMERLNSVVTNLRLRADDEIPTELGTCIAGGFIAQPLEYERVRFGLRLKEFPDVHFSVDVHKNQDTLDETASLELTLKEGEELAKAQGHGDAYARIKTLRRGARQLGRWKGFEMLARKPAYNKDTEAHEFYFHSLGAIHDPLQPQIDVRLNSGVKNNQTQRIRPSLTDEEAVALWDKLIGTIRVRKTNDAKPATAVPASVPLGTLTASGEKCAQDGWWQCTETASVEGGRRRYFSKGETMPQITLLGEPNLWQKLAGVRPRHSTATIWTLTSQESEPLVPTADAAAALRSSDATPAKPHNNGQG